MVRGTAQNTVRITQSVAKGPSSEEGAPSGEAKHIHALSSNRRAKKHINSNMEQLVGWDNIQREGSNEKKDEETYEQVLRWRESRNNHREFTIYGLTRLCMYRRILPHTPA